jgi:multidrug resistance protein
VARNPSSAGVGKILALMVTAFVDMIGFAMVVPLVPFYARTMGATATVIGLLISAFAVAQLVSAPMWGRVSDRYGRRPAILTGLLISGVAYIAFGFADSIWLLLFSRVVQGVGAGTVGVLQAYVADASDADDRAKSLGWLSAATSLGVVAGPALGSLLTALWGHSAPGFGAAGLCFVSSGFAWRHLRESREEIRTGEHAVRHPAAGRRALWRVVTHAAEPAPRLVWIYTLAIGAFYGTVQLIPLLLASRFGVTEKTVGYFIMYFGLMGVVIRALMLDPLVRRYREARMARTGLLVLAAGLALVSVSESYFTLFISFTLMALGTAFLFPCITALLSRVVPPAERGMQMGVQQAFGGISRVVFPTLSGLFLDRFGPGVPFVVAGALVFGTLILTTSLHEYLQLAPA